MSTVGDQAGRRDNVSGILNPGLEQKENKRRLIMQKVFAVRRWGVFRSHCSPVVLKGWVCVSFQFLSPDELGLYRLAARLQKQGYQIRLNRPGSTALRTCQATGWIHVKEAELNQLCLEMISLADRYRVIFDQWDQIQCFRNDNISHS